MVVVVDVVVVCLFVFVFSFCGLLFLKELMTGGPCLQGCIKYYTLITLNEYSGVHFEAKPKLFCEIFS